MTGAPMKADDVAAMLGIGRNSVYAMAKSGEIPSYRVGRKLLFLPDDVQSYLSEARGRNVGVKPCEEDIAVALSRSLPEEGFIICGNGAPADALVQQLELRGLEARRIRRTGYAGLVELYLGAVHAAVMHLYDQRTNSYNVAYIQRLAPGLPVVVFRLVRRTQGFVVAPGNPKRLSSWGALLRDGVRLANRVRGCGSRVLLDEKLTAMEADPYAIDGYGSVYRTGDAAAVAVAQGVADVALVEKEIADRTDGVDYIALQEEWLDIAVAKNGEGRKLIRALKDVFASETFRADYAKLTGGDASHLGSIVYEC